MLKYNKNVQCELHRKRSYKIIRNYIDTRVNKKICEIIFKVKNNINYYIMSIFAQIFPVNLYGKK